MPNRRRTLESKDSSSGHTYKGPSVWVTRCPPHGSSQCQVVRYKLTCQQVFRGQIFVKPFVLKSRERAGFCRRFFWSKVLRMGKLVCCYVPVGAFLPIQRYSRRCDAAACNTACASWGN